jgi:HK97 family phage prohead protease
MPDYTPPQGVQDEAAKAVEWIAEGLAGDGFTATGRRRAQQLADGVAVSEDVVRRMASYFARHEPDTEAEGFNYGEPGYPTPGRVAWSAWGGDPGRTWAESTLSSLDSEDERGTSTQMSDETRDMPESIYPVTPRQAALYDAVEGVAELFGKFDQGIGPDGAHYVAESPFEGMVCSSCVFYEGARACEVVDGDIAPEAVCKLWIIPEALLPGSESEGTDTTRSDMTVNDEYRRTDDGIELPEVEHRRLADVELRMDGDTPVLEGYALVYEYRYDVAGGPEAGGFTEVISRGAAAKSAGEADVRLLVNHDGVPLARSRGGEGTLELESDDIGLKVRAELDPSNPTVQELRSAMNRGDLDQMSFAFRIPKGEGRQEWSKDYSLRTIREVQLFDVSVVTYPANPATVAKLRNDEAPQAEEATDEVVATGRRLDVARAQFDRLARP